VLAKPIEGGGHVGFIVNKPTKMSLAELFPEHEPSKKSPIRSFSAAP